MSSLSHKYLQVQELRRLRALLFQARRPAAGRYTGRHASSRRGRGIEFSDYRPYIPGDTAGDIDWKVYGRSDRLFVRRFEHQSDTAVHLLVDASASMGYSGVEDQRRNRSSPVPSDSKYDYACRMAAAIAFLTLRQHDRVAFGLAQDGLAEFLAPHGSGAQLRAVLGAMERGRPRGPSRLAEAIGAIVSRVPRRGLLVVLSDLLDEPGPVLRALSGFNHRRGEVIVLHVMHPEELSLPAVEDALFTDSETGERLAVNVPEARTRYVERLRRFLEGWSSGCRRRGFQYQLVNTSTPWPAALEPVFLTRSG